MKSARANIDRILATLNLYQSLGDSFRLQRPSKGELASVNPSIGHEISFRPVYNMHVFSHRVMMREDITRTPLL